MSADNSALMRNIRNHENALGKGLGRLLTSLVECARIHCGADVEEGAQPVEVVWDDSIITDTQAEKQQMLAEIALQFAKLLALTFGDEIDGMFLADTIYLVCYVQCQLLDSLR